MFDSSLRMGVTDLETNITDVCNCSIIKQILIKELSVNVDLNLAESELSYVSVCLYFYLCSLVKNYELLFLQSLSQDNKYTYYFLIMTE